MSSIQPEEQIALLAGQNGEGEIRIQGVLRGSTCRESLRRCSSYSNDQENPKTTSQSQSRREDEGHSGELIVRVEGEPIDGEEEPDHQGPEKELTEHEKGLQAAQEDKPFSAKTFILLASFMIVIVVQTVATRKILNNSQVISQSLPASLGVIATVTYFIIGLIVEYKPCSRRKSENGEDISCWKKFTEGCKGMFNGKQLLEFMPSAVCFGLQQSFMMMAPIFVGAAMKQLFAQIKIPLSVIFSLVFLKKKHNAKQWLCIVCLFCLVALFGMLQKDGDDIDESVKLVFGFMVIFLGSTFSVLGCILQEKILKREAKTSIFVQKFQTDFTQLFVTFALLFLNQYFGLGLDKMQAAVWPDAKAGNLYLRQSIFTYRSMVITSTDPYQKGMKFFDDNFNEDPAKTFTATKLSRSDFLEDLYRSQVNKHPVFMSKVAKKAGVDKVYNAEEAKGRKEFPDVFALDELSKAVTSLKDSAWKSPFKAELRLVDPSEWEELVVIGGNSVFQWNTIDMPSKTESRDKILSASARATDKFFVGDLRGVYHRFVLDEPVAEGKSATLGNHIYCRFDTRIKEKKLEYEDGEKMFTTTGCFVKDSANAGAPIWRFFVPNVNDKNAAIRASHKIGATSSKRHDNENNETFGLTKEEKETKQSYLHLVDRNVNPKLTLGDFVHDDWTEINGLHQKSMSNILDLFPEGEKVDETLGSKAEANLGYVAYDVPQIMEQGQQSHNSECKPQLVDRLEKTKAEEKRFRVSLSLQMRRGALAPGVRYSGGLRDFKLGESFICDNLLCAAERWEGYDYVKKSGSIYKRGVTTGFMDFPNEANDYKSKTNEEINNQGLKIYGKEDIETVIMYESDDGKAPHFFQSGFFSGWNWMIVIVLVMLMIQYFLNAVICKEVSAIWNKISHGLATVLMYWIGDLPFESNPEKTKKPILYVNLALLSIAIFAVVILFAATKDKKGEKKVDAEIEMTEANEVEDNLEDAEENRAEEKRQTTLSKRSSNACHSSVRDSAIRQHASDLKKGSNQVNQQK